MYLKNKLAAVLTGCMLASMMMWACSPVESSDNSAAPAENGEFGQYWYQGLAELSRFELYQSRYGEVRRGDAVLIFVTEDFLTDKQVKYEFGGANGNVASVLKLNFTRKFHTGIYPYSMMTSVFTPVDARYPRTFKATTTVQEWCGHTFSQFNYREGQYEAELRSYFQAEGDRDLELKGVMLEDALWTRIRLNPEALPVGEVELIPNAQYLRLAHADMKVRKARAEIETITDRSLSPNPLSVYRITYDDVPRKLAIKFEQQFPYRILAWEESYVPGFGSREWVTTKATRTNELRLDYWSKNSVSDSTYRAQLGLSD